MALLAEGYGQGLTIALIGLLGVGLGAAISAVVPYILQRAADKRRWQREDQRFYHPERVEAYKAFARAVTRHTMAYDFMESEAFSEHLPHPFETAVQLVEAYADAYTFASAPVENAARHLLDIAFSSDAGEDDLSEARTAFLDAVHEELGVPLGPSEAR